MARIRLIHDGGMCEFRDPVSDEVVGCCGIHTMAVCASPAEDWVGS
jgi:hypothetical protein